MKDYEERGEERVSSYRVHHKLQAWSKHIAAVQKG